MWRPAISSRSTSFGRWHVSGRARRSYSASSTTSTVRSRRYFPSSAPPTPYATAHMDFAGSANGLKTKGSQWSTVAPLGEWRSLRFLGYVDLTPELDRDLSNLSIETEDIDADLDDEVRTLGAGPHKASRNHGLRAPAAVRMGLIFSNLYFLLGLKVLSFRPN